MRIGELGTRVGVPPKTIRYYEEIGIMPEPDRTPTGYRDYRDEAAPRLRFIRTAQDVGFSLGEIREILALRDRGAAPCLHVTELIERHAREMDERIQTLQQMRTDLERLAERAREARPRERQTPYCHIIELAAPANRRS
ncbi:MAG: heavy metal-responsive transcriptional regulator [Actinomycetota bacterium]